MSEIKKLSIAVKDERGIILDIFKSSPKDHCALITFKKDSQRANHFHKESTQYTFLVSGQLLMRTAKVNDQGDFVGEIKENMIDPYTLITHLPYEAHSFLALSDSTILAFACGTRGGDDYEKDVFRIKSMFK